MLHRYTKISNIFYKINFRYLPRSEAVLICAIKRLFWSFLKSYRPTTCTFILKKTHVQVKFTKYLTAPFWQDTPGWLLLLDTLLFVSYRMVPSTLFFFWFALNIFGTNTLDCLRIVVSGNPGQLAMPELLLIKQAIHLNSNQKLEAVLQQYSGNMMFCKTSQIS